jgi:cysteine desulfurase
MTPRFDKKRSKNYDGRMEWLNNLFNPKKRIYLDYAAATPVRLEAQNEMAKYWSAHFYNPSAIYEEGLVIKKEIDDYRSRLAALLGAGQKEIIFTGSGTESVNLAILGAFEESLYVFKRPHIIISAIEHSAVVRAADEVVRRGGECSVVPVDEEGRVSLEALKKLIKNTTFLISISLANSEIGVVQPISAIGRLVRERRKARNATNGNGSFLNYPMLHTDASAAPAYLPATLESLQCEMITLDGSKISGPKGIGLLAVRRGVKLRPIILGGSQEEGRRAGTLSPALIAGLTVALELAAKERAEETKRMESLRGQFVAHVVKVLPQAAVNGSLEDNLPNIVSISVPGILAEMVVLQLDREGVCASVGTACSLDERVSGSPVIRALGKPELAESTVRFSFGRQTTATEVKRAAEIFLRILSKNAKIGS